MNKVSAVTVGVVFLALAFGTKVFSVSESIGAQIEPVVVIEDESASTAQIAHDEAREKEFAERNAKLAEREKTISEGEAKLEAFEKRVGMEVEKLETIRNELAALKDSLVTQQTEDLKRLATLYTNMKPKEAAAVLNTMSVDDVVKIIDGMSATAAAPLLGDLEPKLAKEVTSRILARGAKLAE